MKEWKAPVGYVEKKFNYVYKLTLKQDPRYYYIGVHASNIEPKFDYYSGSGRNLNKYRELYGKDCFSREELSFWNTKEEALKEERRLVTEELIKDPFCLNKIKGGGTFDTTGRVLSLEERQRISEKRKGYKRSPESVKKMVETRILRGYLHHSEETKRKLSEIRKGKPGNPWPEESRKKLSKARKGKNNPMFGKKVSEEIIKKVLETKRKNNTLQHSEETKAKLTRLNREKAKDPEYRKKLSEAARGKNTWTKGRKKIFNPVTGEKKIVQEKDLGEYLKNGWKQGMGYKAFVDLYKEGVHKRVSIKKKEEMLQQGWCDKKVC